VNADKLSKYSRPIVASLLISGGMLQLAAPVLALGTDAGTQITNTATASYEDPTDPNKPLNTFSNTVKVAVAEVAGITVVADTFAIVKGGTNTGVGAEAGDKVNFDYVIMNVGNDATQFRIPGTATVAGAGSVDKVQYFDTATSTWIDIPNAGEFISPSKLPGESLKVRVVTSILTGAGANTDVVVTLGNTTAPGAQNVARDASGGDVYTVDNANGVTGEVNGAPENGVREASVSQKVTIGATPEAFATITKVHGAQDPGVNPNILTDDTLTYTLALKVAGQADVPATSNKIAADLAATTINLDSDIAAKRVLVSDAVPQYTTAKSVTTPAGWTAVYTTSVAATVNADKAPWLTIPGTGLVAVPAGATRVGFVSTGPIAKGTTTPNMLVTVELTNMPVAGGNVANIAQVFGSTDINGTLKPVYDESGDNKPNNFNDNGTPAVVDPVTGNPVVGTGVVDPTNPGVTDTNNNNTGTGDAGEPNVVAVVPPGQAGILNGTSNKPDAVGPTGNNDDFTNVSAPIPATTWVLDTVTTSPTFGTYTPSPIDPGAVPFSNTFQTAIGSPIGSVDLLPATPATPLPSGTKVTISYGGTSKVYSFDGTKFVNVDPATGLATTTAATPLVVPGVVPGAKVNYGVEVDLPAGTPQLAGYSVPVTAFVDVNGDGLLDATEPQNQTVDRVYTGYLKLTKEAQITDANGGIVEAFTAAPNKKAQPGQSIEYRITYKNISEVAPVNSGSVTLNAQNIKVTEDGNAAPNNWAPITTHKGSSATDSNNGAITFDGGASNNSTPTVAVYKDVVAGPLAPQAIGTFSFTRIVK
jgi:hypothetical protein